ncbi:hypothetical protein [Kaarinaea lacus]
MTQLDLTKEEQDTLKDVLENYLADLRQQISATDLHDFKEMLKTRKEVVIKVLNALTED